MNTTNVHIASSVGKSAICSHTLLCIHFFKLLYPHTVQQQVIFTIIALMGSLSSPIPTPSTPESPNSLIYASFCSQSTPNWLESYDPITNTRVRVSTIPTIPETNHLKGFALISLDSSIYVIGGRLCLKESTEVDLEVRSIVLRYSTATRQWTACASLITPRFDFACAPCNGKIYVAGGRSSLSRGPGTAATEVYDPASDRWDPLPNMSAMRYKCVGVEWQGSFYAVGGFAVRWEFGGRTVPSAVERSSAEVFDQASGEWALITNMWQLDVPPNQIVAVLGRRLFSSGDCLNTWKGYVEAYDGKLNIWNIVEWSNRSDLSSLLTSEGGGECGMKRSYLTMAAIGTRLYFLAGYVMQGDEDRSLSAVHVFDTAVNDEGAWSTSEVAVEEGDKELCAHCCAVSI